MVTELALLRVGRGRGAEFETAFSRVASLLTGADGYKGHRLVPTLDDADLYLLEVEWRDFAAHTEGFEPSEEHQRFMSHLEPFLLDEPIVVHVPAGKRS